MSRRIAAEKLVRAFKLSCLGLEVTLEAVFLIVPEKLAFVCVLCSHDVVVL